MKTINGDVFLSMLQNGANNLANNHHEINALNVFPVPDGDTGTNMNLTFSSGVADAKKVMTSHLGTLSKTLSRGLLMGARGNSGVILSQIFRGFSQVTEELSEATVLHLAQAFQKGTEVAYKAVMRPVEGTILTVLRESSQSAYEHAMINPDISVLEYFEFLLAKARVSLENTPELLSVLKEVGVVDSGGCGYVTVLEGFVAALEGKTITLSAFSEPGHVSAHDLESEEYGYCTEFIIRVDGNAPYTYDETKFKAELEAMGNSIVVVSDDDIVKVHIHTLKPGNALNMGQRYGEFVKLKIENMTEQHNTILDQVSSSDLKQEKHDKYAIISVATGEGVVQMFKELRAEYIINGGQTMNPSTEDFVALINKISADHILILPNNSNIILAAKQAMEICEDKDVRVIETKSIPQGLAACVMFNPEIDVASNIEEMTDSSLRTKTGQVTYAIKDTVFDSIAIKENDFIGIVEKDIVTTGPDKLSVARQLCETLIDADSEIITIIAGDDVSDDEFASLTQFVEENFGIDVEARKGNQPVYSFILGVE